MHSNAAIFNVVQTLIVIGNGMVGHHCVEQLGERGGLDRYHIYVCCKEPLCAYGRVVGALAG